MISVPAFAQNGRIRLTQVRNDGKPARELVVGASNIIGRSEGDFTFPNDSAMQPKHARVLVDSGQLFVEPMAGAATYFSLVGPYRLQTGDVIKLGGQILEFQANSAALEMAASTGATVKEVSAKLQKPVAELLSLSDQKHFSLPGEETTFGRTKGTYTFADSAMSRSHARIYHRGEDFFIEDTGSTNGTFMKVRERTPVPDTAIVSVGGQLFRVVRDK